MNLMIMVFVAALLCTLVALCSAYVFLLSDLTLKRWSTSLIAVACGVLLGDAFFHLLPEALESAREPESILTWTLIGIVAFYLLEQSIKWQWAPDASSSLVSSIKRLPFMNLSGDALHNATDGVLIATSFMADSTLGVATTLAIVLHEIPQEMTDIAVLIRGGWSKSQAFISNALCALMTPVAALITVLLGTTLRFELALLLAITAGGFVYIALAKLMPLLMPAHEASPPLAQFGTVLVGVLSMQLLLWVE